MLGATAGLRILDLTEGLAGPLATMILADFGADVIRFEDPSDDHATGRSRRTCCSTGARRASASTCDPPAVRQRSRGSSPPSMSSWWPYPQKLGASDQL